VKLPRTLLIYCSFLEFFSVFLSIGKYKFRKNCFLKLFIKYLDSLATAWFYHVKSHDSVHILVCTKVIM